MINEHSEVEDSIIADNDVACEVLKSILLDGKGSNEEWIEEQLQELTIKEFARYFLSTDWDYYLYWHQKLRKGDFANFFSNLYKVYNLIGYLPTNRAFNIFACKIDTALYAPFCKLSHF